MSIGHGLLGEDHAAGVDSEVLRQASEFGSERLYVGRDRSGFVGVDFPVVREALGPRGCLLRGVPERFRGGLDRAAGPVRNRVRDERGPAAAVSSVIDASVPSWPDCQYTSPQASTRSRADWSASWSTEVSMSAAYRHWQ
jgi:hypothetical protein